MSTNKQSSNANQGVLVIQLILAKIADNDTKAVTENLSRLPLAVVGKDQAETLLSWFLNQATKSMNVEAAREIIITFDRERIRVDPLPAITNMFLNPSLSREVLSFVVSCFPEKSPIDFFVDLINMGDDVSALKTAGILTTYFPNLTGDDWDTLVKLTDNVEEEEYENQLLRAFFQSKAAETGQCAERPVWIRDDLNEPEIQEIPTDLPTVKEAIDLLLADLHKQKIRTTSNTDGDDHDIHHELELKETLISQYAISSIVEKIHMLSQVKEIPMFNDIPLFQEFGPVNTIYTLSPALIDPQHECCKYGGCRMLLCTEFEQMYTDGDEIDLMAADDQVYIQDWFRGSCDKCIKKIQRRHYAIRRPLRHGGWCGCYCSIDCMKEDIDDPNVAVMVGRIQEQLTVMGIRERD